MAVWKDTQQSKADIHVGKVVLPLILGRLGSSED
jgi:hypothetical protein